MTNLWPGLPSSPPYVLTEDDPHIEAFNDLFGGQDGRYRLDLRLFPEPFMGSRNAMLVILARNPGISPGDHTAHQNPRHLRAMRANLEEDPAGHLLTGLLDEFNDTPAGVWWRPRLRQLALQSRSYEELARKLLVVEFHGYHSTNWHSIGITLPSQLYGFELVGKAVARGAVIVVTRGANDWDVGVPTLRNHPAVYRLKSTRNAAISAGNLGRDAFKRVVAALE